MSNKLSRDELLVKMEDWLEGLLEYGSNNDRQAYQQIKAILTKFDEECVKSYKTGYKAGVVNEYSRMRKKKPVVTEEWVEQKAKEVLNVSHHFYLNPYAKLKDFEDFIRSLVEEMPVKKMTVSEEFVEEESYCLEWKDKDELKNELIPKMLKKAGLA